MGAAAQATGRTREHSFSCAHTHAYPHLTEDFRCMGLRTGGRGRDRKRDVAGAAPAEVDVAAVLEVLSQR